MNVQATGYYRYWTGETIIEGLERLEVVARFKVSGKFLRKKLTRSISIKSAVDDASLFSDESYNKEEEYYNSLEKIIDDEVFLIKTIKNMVREWFVENSREEINKDRKMSLSNKARKKDEISVKVKI